jgi:hypothetical protein
LKTVPALEVYDQALILYSPALTVMIDHVSMPDMVMLFDSYCVEIVALTIGVKEKLLGVLSPEFATVMISNNPVTPQTVNTVEVRVEKLFADVR